MREENKSYLEKVDERKIEMYQEYLASKLDLVFNDELGDGKRNIVGLRVKNHETVHYSGNRYREGYAVYKNWMGRYDFLDNNGNLVIGGIGVIDYKGDEVEGVMCELVHDFNYGKALAKRIEREGGHYYYFSISDNGIINTFGNHFEKAFDYVDGYGRVKREGKWNYADVDCHYMLPEWVDDASDIKFARVKVRRGAKIETVYLGMPGYKIKLTVGGYFCFNEKNKFKIKHQPVKMFNERNILCTDRNNYYVFDIKTNKYFKVGPVKDIFYDDNLIYNEKNRKVLLAYNDNLIDITEYFIKNLMNKTRLHINHSLDKILSMEEFVFMEMEEIDKMMVHERKKNTDILLKQKEELKQKELREKIEKEKKLEEERKEKRLEGLKKLKEGLELLKSSGSELKIQRIQYDIDLIDKGDHYEIPKEIIPALKYIDLSLLDFNKLKVDGIDFSGCNIEHLDPQIVYNKDLSNCNLEGIFLRPLISFEGVNICGTKFSYDNSDLTMNIFNSSLSRAIYDENTTFNGIPLSIILEGQKGSKK